MQGLNRYIPPDYDPRKNSTLNSHQGKKHALGVRAKDIDKGILVVRFELPFNIWCGTCNAHIGAGVRYNARKQKVGNYYSSPIFAFKCKCHLCDGWFEIRTDPKNAAYVVHEGARKKDEDWNPEENGGFAVHDTEAPSASDPSAIDPFLAVEKTIDQQKWAKRGTSRITELTIQSNKLNSDPYLISSSLRRKFREDKKLALENQIKDDELKEKYGLNNELIHFNYQHKDDNDNDNKEQDERSARIWKNIQENKFSLTNKGESSSSPMINKSVSPAVPTTRNSVDRNGKGKGKALDSPTNINLASVLRKNTGKKYDPFSDVSFTSSTSSTNSTPVKLSSTNLLDGIKTKGKIKGNIMNNMTVTKKEDSTGIPLNTASSGLSGGLLSGYGSD
ncbi:uncharacterized protein L201_007688 [Kwoniella dendrophila CBS 6074]|uniref:Coiled-coil domain-containing protein 130 n=1 Tax=Kwoniella dendrophila CBS 6074 TaxID=1295534 RepID=A0AAX4K5R4_9TREE